MLHLFFRGESGGKELLGCVGDVHVCGWERLLEFTSGNVEDRALCAASSLTNGQIFLLGRNRYIVDGFGLLNVVASLEEGLSPLILLVENHLVSNNVKHLLVVDQVQVVFVLPVSTKDKLGR